MNETVPRPTKDREIASTRDGMDITRGYTGPLLVPADKLLRTRGGSDLSIYEQVLSEPQVHTTFQQRRLAVVNREWQVEAASSRVIDQRAAAHVREQLQRVGFDARTNRMLYGIYYGFAVAELLYGVRDGLITWEQIKVRDRRRFRFTPAGELRMLTFANMFEGVELPPQKFWQFATGSDHDDEPYGLGLGHWCYWPTLFKRNGIKFWLTFIEKFASPTGIGEYDSNASDAEKSKLLGAVQEIQSDSGIIIPKGMEIRLLEAARSGSADYKTLHDTMDETIAKIVLGQSASTQGAPGKLGEEQLQSDVREELVKADADLVCESLNIGPIRWLTQWNFPDADPPRVFRVFDDGDDLSARATRDQSVVGMGFKPTLKYVTETYGGEWVETGSKSIPAPVSFAAPTAGEVTPVVGQAETLSTASAPPWSAILDKVDALVQSAADLDSLRASIVDAYADLPVADLGNVMAIAEAAAMAVGRYDVQQESAVG